MQGGVFRQRTLSGSGIRRKKIGIVENLYPRFRLAQTQHGDWSNSGGRRLLLAILRRVNRFGMELEVPGFTVQEKAEVRAYYSQSNENVLGQCYGLDVLKEYGYIS